MRTECYDTLDDVLVRQAQWDSLLETALDSSPFMSADWLISWWVAFAEADWRMRFITVWDESELCGIAPLLIRHERRWGRNCRVMTFWSNAWSNRAGIVVRSRDADAIAAELVREFHRRRDEWDVVELGPVVLADRSTRLLLDQFAIRGMPHGAAEVYASPFRQLPDKWEQLESSLGSSFRQTLRRKVKKATRSDVSFAITTDCSRLPDMFEISAETWQHSEDTGIGSTEAIRKFYEEVAARTERSGRLSLAFLLVDGAPVAFEFNLVHHRTVYNLKVGYRPAHRDLSPGLVLRDHVLKHAVSNCMREFDFLGAAEDYKMHWASGVRPHGNLVVFSTTAYWRVVHFLDYRVRPFIKRNVPWAATLLRRIRGDTKKTVV